MSESGGQATTGPQGWRDDYRIIERLPDLGGQGFVFRARLVGDRLGPDLDGCEVALKQLIAGSVGWERQHEVLALLTRRTHPHLGRVLEVFTGPPPTVGVHDDEDLTYVSALWVPGRGFDQAVVGADLPTILRWVAQVGSAVDYLHLPSGDAPALTHRDIKPSNVIVTPEGDAVLIDPGLARPVRPDAAGGPHGSPGYLPPECRLDPRASGPAGDRWQVGALLYAALVGEPPGRATPDLLAERLRHAPLLIRDRDAAGPVVRALLHLLDRDPAMRPPSAGRWALDLLADLPTDRSPSVRGPGRPFLAGAVAVTLAVLAGLAGWMLHPAEADPVYLPDATPAVPHAFLPVDSVLRGPAAVDTRPLLVFNRVTSGATGMREDVPSYLSSHPIDYCMEYGCALPNTDMDSGTRLSATCLVLGEITTNGNDNTSLDAANPGRFTSDLWFGVRLPDGRFGYLSAVWTAPVDRDGLGLARC